MEKKYSIMIVSQVSKDIFDSHREEFLGGPVSYGGSFLATTNMNCSILAKAAKKEIEKLHSLLPSSINIMSKVSKHTTTFLTSYVNGKRVQKITTRCKPFTIKDVRGYYSDYIHASPIINDIPLRIIAELRKNCKILSYDPLNNDDGIINDKTRNGVMKSLQYVDIAKLSHSEAVALMESDDILELCKSLNRLVPTVIITAGREGAYFCQDKKILQFKPLSVNVVDTCGCGDVLSSAFLTYLYMGKNFKESAEFAVRASALKTRGQGLSSVPSYKEVVKYGK